MGIEQRVIAVGDSEIVELRRLCERMATVEDESLYDEMSDAFDVIVESALGVDLQWSWMVLGAVFNEAFGSDLWLVSDGDELPNSGLPTTITSPERVAEAVERLPVMSEKQLLGRVRQGLAASLYPATSWIGQAEQAAEIAREVIALLRTAAERNLYVVNIPA